MYEPDEKKHYLCVTKGSLVGQYMLQDNTKPAWYSDKRLTPERVQDAVDEMIGKMQEIGTTLLGVRCNIGSLAWLFDRHCIPLQICVWCIYVTELLPLCAVWHTPTDSLCKPPILHKSIRISDDARHYCTCHFCMHHLTEYLSGSIYSSV